MAARNTESYKGVRDFYPEDKFIRDYITNTMAGVCESFGYESYDASILEPAELYKSKTSEEIVTEQTYTFEDRGGREVTLRPEMTPTVARMVAARHRELSFPLRWYSIPNCFRYERTQRGRLREFWQLNADLFGVAGTEGDAEMIALAHAIMRAFGAHEADFEIRVNSRNLTEHLFTEQGISNEERPALMRLLDKMDAIDTAFTEKLTELLGADRATQFIAAYEHIGENHELTELFERLRAYGITNAHHDPTIARGFDYYTGIVFEVYDTAPENSRALFGGGRYDNLLEVFGSTATPTVGFGMGDVTMRDFLETHSLLPAYVPATDVMLCVLEDDAATVATNLAQTLREQDISVAVNYSYKKAGDQIKVADKKGIPFVICIGAQEVATEQFTVKHLASREETTLPAAAIADHIFTQEL